MAKRFVRNDKWRKQPHSKGAPGGLWWYRRPDRQRVISAYLARAAKGKKLAPGFEEELKSWLHELANDHNMHEWGRPRTRRFWDIPSFARHLGPKVIKPHTLMKIVRELENVAKLLFPKDVPASRQKKEISDEALAALKAEVAAGVEIRLLAAKYDIKAFRIGQLCPDEIKKAPAERERLINEHMTETSGAATPHSQDNSDMPF